MRLGPILATSQPVPTGRSAQPIYDDLRQTHPPLGPGPPPNRKPVRPICVTQIPTCLAHRLRAQGSVGASTSRSLNKKYSISYFLAFSATQTTPHSRPVQIRLISFVRDLSPGSDWSHPLRPSWSTGRAAPVLRDPRHILPFVVFTGSRNPHGITAAQQRQTINSSRRETTS